MLDTTTPSCEHEKASDELHVDSTRSTALTLEDRSQIRALVLTCGLLVKS